MRVLAVLWTVCLVRLCSAFLCCFGGSKTDDDNAVQAVQGGSNEVSTENLRAVPPQQPVVPQSVGQPTITTPITLSLASPDESKLDVYEEKFFGALLKSYSGKKGYHIDFVADSGATVWTASGNEKCTLVKSYSKHGVTILSLEIDGSCTKYKYLEKANGSWNEIGRELFDDKVEEMRKSGLLTTPTQGSPNPASKIPTSHKPTVSQ